MMPVRSRSVPQCATAAKRLPHRQSAPSVTTRLCLEYTFSGGYAKNPKLEPRDLSALTPLIWEHVNPYGRFELDMNTRIPLD